MSRAHGGDEPTPAEMLTYGPTESETRAFAVTVLTVAMIFGAGVLRLAQWIFSHVSIAVHW